MLSPTISIVEVGPRDGLQNAPEILSFEQKKNFISYLLAKGFMNLEAGSFVRPDRIPSMSNSDQLARHFKKESNHLWYLVPNQKGLETALANGARQLAFFTAASDTFNQKNIGMTADESIVKIKTSLDWLRDQGYSIVTDWNQDLKDPTHDPRTLKLRLYISTVMGCPYEGVIAPQKTISLIEKLLPLGFSQVSLGDTIGVGVPGDWKILLKNCDSHWIQKNQLALHCHDTYGTALTCIAKGIELGIRTIDSSIGGLGGCPFAPGASGNVATEDVLYFLEKEGFSTGLAWRELSDCFHAERTGNLTNLSKMSRIESCRSSQKI